MKYFLSIILFLSVSQGAMAHDGHMNNLMTAVLHPLMGWDHLLAMLLVGILVARYELKARILLPILFVLGFGISAQVATVNSVTSSLISSMYVEQILFITLSILGFALLTKKVISLKMMLAVALIAGLSHGYVHGLELNPHQATVLLGLMSTTALLHGLGYFLSHAFYERFQYLFKALGAISSIAGIAALILTY